jgi:hypothetical protein
VTSYTSPEMEIQRSSADACARSSLEETMTTSPAASSGGDIASAVERDVGVGAATGIGGTEGGGRSDLMVEGGAGTGGISVRNFPRC